MRRYVELVNIFVFLIFCFQVSSCKKITSETKVTGGLDAENKLWALGVVRIHTKYSPTDSKDDEYWTSCTASIVSHNTLLTAAHCITDKTDDNKLIETTDIRVDYKTSENQTEFTSAYYEKFMWNNENFKSDTLNFSDFVYDIAVIKFPDNTFKHIKPLVIAPYTVDVGSSVVVIGYGCITDVFTKDGKKSIDCKKEDSDSLKRYGYTIVTQSNYCNNEEIQLTQTNPIADSEIDNPTGKNVAGDSGDSGGPLLTKIKDEWYICGIYSYKNVTIKTNRYSCYVNPLFQTNFELLYHAINQIGVNIPGINISVGVIELGGKVRVVEKQYDNIYTKGIKDTPFTITSIRSYSKQCSQIKSSGDLWSCWQSFYLKEKEASQWN